MTIMKTDTTSADKRGDFMNRSRMFLPLVALLALVAIIACTAEQPTPVATNAPFVTELASAMDQAGEKNQNALLEFYTDW